MARPKKPKLPAAPKTKRGTVLTFTREELNELARYPGAGAALLQSRPRVSSRIQGALKRLGVRRKPLVF